MKEHITVVKIGSTVFVVTSECSAAATETVEQKLMRMMNRHVCEVAKPAEVMLSENQVNPVL